MHWTASAAAFVSALLKFGPWALVILAAIGWVRSYGNERAAEALALARADSIVWAQDRHDSLEVSRESVRQALEAAVQGHDRARDSLPLAVQAESRSRVNLGRLAAILADTGTAISDTVRVVVREAIEGLEEERDVCRARLGTCEATRLLLENRIRIDSTSLLEKDSLLFAFNEQLADAIKHRRWPAGILRWAERGLVLYAIIRLGTDLLQKDNGR